MVARMSTEDVTPTQVREALERLRDGVVDEMVARAVEVWLGTSSKRRDVEVAHPGPLTLQERLAGDLAKIPGRARREADVRSARATAHNRAERRRRAREDG